MNTQNKVLFVLRLPPPYGGGEIVSEILYNGLKHRDNFSFLCFKRKGHSKSRQAKVSLLTIFYGISYLFRVFTRIIILRPDMIYIGLPKSFFAFLRSSLIITFCTVFKIKVFAELHGESFLFENNNLKRSILKFTLNRCYRIRVLGENIKLRISKFSNKPEFLVIPNGVDLPQGLMPTEFTSENPEVWSFLYFGAISSAKGFFDFIDLFSRLLENRIVNFRLNIIGEWVSDIEYEIFLKKYEGTKIYDKLLFHGLIKDDQKWNAVKQNHFLVHLSKYDGQPMTIIETMALGIPSITTSVGAIPEMIVHNINGFIVNSVDDAYHLLLDKLFQNNVDYSSMRMNSLEIFNSRFRSNHMIEKIYRAIKEYETTHPTVKIG